MSRGGVLENDEWLWRWKLGAGALSWIALAGLFLTSLNRSPGDVWTMITGIVVVAVAAGIVHGVMRRRHRRRRGS